MTIHYVEAIDRGFPGCYVSAAGDAYSDLVWVSGNDIPSQEALDAWIVANGAILEDKRITVLALLNRFTDDEHIQIQLARAWVYDLTQSMQLRAAAASLDSNIQKALAAQYIDLALPINIQGINNLEYFPSPLGPMMNANGHLLATGRASQILNNPILPNERPPTSVLDTALV